MTSAADHDVEENVPEVIRAGSIADVNVKIGGKTVSNTGVGISPDFQGVLDGSSPRGEPLVIVERFDRSRTRAPPQ